MNLQNEHYVLSDQQIVVLFYKGGGGDNELMEQVLAK